MKVTPLATSQGVPADMNPSTQRTSPDRLEAAKAIARGDSPMRLAPSETPIDPQVARLQNNTKRLKMRTQVSPDRQIEEAAPIEQAQPVQSATNDAIEQTPVDEETKPLSPQFAALAKQRRALQQERATLDREKAELAAKGQTTGSTLDLDRLKADPLSVLDEAGVLDDKFYNSLTERLVSGQSNPAMGQIAALKAEIEALKSGVDTKFTERDNHAEQQVLAEVTRESAQLVSEGDEFKYTRAMRKSAEAARLIHENWKKTGDVWDTPYALSLIEAECKKEYDTLSQALTPQQEQQLAQQQQQVRQPQGMRTLTNRDTARPIISRRDRMIAAFEGRLKK